MSSSPYRVSIATESPQRHRLSQAWVRNVARLVLSAEGVPSSSRVEVLLAGDETVRRLNADYRSEDAVTDVLSFPGVDHEGGGGGDIDCFPRAGGWRDVGQIALSVPQAERQAREARHSLQDESAHLIVHGLLHLLGYDHAVPPDETVMRSREDALLRDITGRAAHQDGPQPDSGVAASVGGAR